MLRFRGLRLFFTAFGAGMMFGIPSYDGWWYPAQLASIGFLTMMYVAGLKDWFVDRRKLEIEDEIRSFHLSDVAAALRDEFKRKADLSDNDCTKLANIAIEVIKREM